MTQLVADWHYYTIEGREYYAPSLDFAFGMARAAQPFRANWTCTGSRR